MLATDKKIARNFIIQVRYIHRPKIVRFNVPAPQSSSTTMEVSQMSVINLWDSETDWSADEWFKTES